MEDRGSNGQLAGGARVAADREEGGVGEADGPRGSGRGRGKGKLAQREMK